ncbi:MAG: GntG family PLP-dependent aldolase [Bacteroidota bacterium]
MNKNIIDLRSDTITKPTPPMLHVMLSAQVGDDVFEDDPTVNALEAKSAALFGTEAALFCVSGTMTNQLAIRTHCSPGSEVICDVSSHVFQYEGGGIAVNALSSVKTLQGDRGRLSAAQVERAINDPADVHKAVTRLVSLENTANKGGGSIYDFSEIQKIKTVCLQHGLKLHLDGARLFNALAETNEKPEEYGKIFDSISICLSKSLGCPVGSLLLGSKQTILHARRFRKLMGGGWRQAGYLAAAGIYALDNNIQRLKDDHRRAKAIAQIVSSAAFAEKLYPVETNIVIIELPAHITDERFVSVMAEHGVLCVSMGKQLVRFVTHMEFDDDQLMQFEKCIRAVKF